MISSTAALLISAGVAAAGAAGSAYNRNKAKNEELRSYQEARDFLNSQYYRDPLTTVGNRSLLKAASERYDKNLDAINNRMAAGGGTMENALAARQSNNEGMSRLYGQLLQGEDARRDRINAQKLQLDQNHSSALQANYRQAAQDWQQWGAQTSSALMSYGSASLLGNGAEVAGAGAVADSVPPDGLVEMYAPIRSPKAISQGVTGLAGGLPWDNNK